MTFEEQNKFIVKHKQLGFDELCFATGLSKKKVIDRYNFLTGFEWKTFTRTNIDDYIEDTGRTISGRKIYRFTKEFKFYPSPNETVIIPKGFEYDFMSIPRFAQWYIKSDAKWGKLASLLHDYRFATKSKSFSGTNFEFVKYIHMFGARPDQSFNAWLAVQTGGIVAWRNTTDREARLNLMYYKKITLEYNIKNSKKVLSSFNNLI